MPCLSSRSIAVSIVVVGILTAALPMRSVLAQSSRTREQLKQIAELEAQLVAMTEETGRVTRSIDIIKKWGTCDVVLGSRTSASAVALQMSANGKVQVVDIALDSRVADCLTYAWKNGVPRVWSAEAQRLLTEINRSSRPGDELGQQLADRVREVAWSVPDYASVSGKDRNPPYVLFQEQTAVGQQRGGFFLSVEGDELVYRPVAEEPRRLLRRMIVPGSMRVDTAREVLDSGAIEQGSSFLDYCILQVGHKLTPTDGRPTHPIVAVHIDVKCQQPINDGSIDSKWQNRLNLFSLLFGMKPVQPQRDPCEAFNKVASRAEDIVYDKLVGLKIAVTERKFHQNSLLEQGSSIRRTNRSTATIDREDVATIAKQHEATHLLVMRVEEPTAKSSSYYLTMRLVDLRSNQALLSLSGENAAPPEDVTSPMFLHSGKLAIGRWTDRGRKEPLPGIEQPPVIPVASFGPTTKLPTRQLVLQEESAKPGELIIRSLFSRQLHRLPADDVELEPVTNNVMERLNTEPELRSQLHRFVMWRMVPPAMTPAGRVNAVLDSENLVETSLGIRQQLTDGARLRIARPVELLGDGTSKLSSKMPMRLPVALNVSELEEDSSRAFYRSPSVQVSYWNSDANKPREGDLVVARFVPKQTVAIYPPYPPSGGPNDAFDWRDSDLQVLMRKANLNPQVLVQGGRQIAEQVVRNRFRDAFTSLGISALSDLPYQQNLNEQSILEAAHQRGATLVCWGRLLPEASKGILRWRVEMRLDEITVDDKGHPMRGRTLTQLEPFYTGKDGKDW